MPRLSRPRMRKDPRPRYPAGVGASLAAEAVFVVLVAAVLALQGKDPWMVVRIPASFLLGPDAVRPHGWVPGDVLLGTLVHLWMAVLVGLLYAALLPRLRLSPVTGGLVAAGLLYALGFWILPLLFPEWLAPFWLPPTGRALQAGTHAVYGLVFGWVYARLR